MRTRAWLWLALPAACGIVSCAPRSGAIGQQRALPRGASHCDDVRAREAFLTGAASDDSARLPQQRATRTAGTLRLKLDDGRVVTLQDDQRGCADGTPDCNFYRLMEWIEPRHAYLVRVSGYEAGAFLLIDARTGARMSLQGVPVWSPTGEWLAADVLVEADMAPGFVIYTWPDGKQVFDREETDAGHLCLQGWDSAAQLAFTEEPAQQGTAVRAARLYVVRTQQGWQQGRVD